MIFPGVKWRLEQQSIGKEEKEVRT